MIQKEIQPDDEEFEQQENITPHTYNPDEIEVGGEKVKLPVTEEFLKEKKDVQEELKHGASLPLVAAIEKSVVDI